MPGSCLISCLKEKKAREVEGQVAGVVTAQERKDGNEMPSVNSNNTVLFVVFKLNMNMFPILALFFNPQ